MSRQSGQQRPIPQWQDITLAPLMLLLSLSKAPENNLIPPVTRIKLVVVHHELEKANEVLKHLQANTLVPALEHFSASLFSANFLETADKLRTLSRSAIPLHQRAPSTSQWRYGTGAVK
jgi:hypothetical protein